MEIINVDKKERIDNGCFESQARVFFIFFLQQSRMEERLDDAIHVLRHHAGEPQMAGLAAAVGGGGGGHQNLSMMHSGGNHPNGMSGMSSYSGMGGISSHVDQMVRGSVMRERESEKKKENNE